jgi:hypothetical protein
MHAAGLDRTPQRGTGREQPALADHLVEGARAHALGERAQFIAVDVQQVGRGFGSGGLAGQGVATMREDRNTIAIWRRGGGS